MRELEQQQTTENKDNQTRAAEYYETAKNQAWSSVRNIYADGSRYQDFLTFSSRFPEMNAENCALVYAQNPAATQLNTYQVWKQQGRQVKKGEKGIDAIWQGSSTRKVFDIRQTEGSLPEESDSGTLTYEQLKLICKSAFSYDVEERNIQKETVTGFSDFYRKKMYIRLDLTEQDKTAALLYQLSWIHARTPDYGGTEKTARAVQAESAVCILARQFSCPQIVDFSYIANWSRELTTENLLRNLETIRQTAKKLTDVIQNSLQELRTKEVRHGTVTELQQRQEQEKQRNLQKDTVKAREKNYYLESVRDDNDIDLDREKSRKALGFRDYDLYQASLNETAQRIIEAEKISMEPPPREKVTEDLKKGNYLSYLSVYEALLTSMRMEYGSEALSGSPYADTVQQAITAIHQFHRESTERADALERQQIPSQLVEQLFQLEFKLQLDDSLRKTEFTDGSPRLKVGLGLTGGEVEQKIQEYKEFIRENQHLIEEPMPSRTPEEALQISLEKRGKVDLPYMMGLSDLSEATLLQELEGKIFLNIGGTPDGNKAMWVTAEEYLQGDLPGKLQKVQESYSLLPDSRLLSNIKALQGADRKAHTVTVPNKARLQHQLKKAKARAVRFNEERKEMAAEKGRNFKRRAV